MTQSQFADALLRPDAQLPFGVQDPQGRPSPKRFSVYRNNVASSLISAMEAAFPVIRKLVGTEYFAALAAEFIRRHPPKTRVLMLYGAEFADFLCAFPPVAHLGYLGDVAELEQLIRESYHAADAPTTLPQDFATLDEAALYASRFTFSPSTRLFSSAWPIYGIWLANSKGGPNPTARAETVLILRRDFDPEPHLLSPAEARCVTALMFGQPLHSALTQAGDELNLEGLLTRLIQNNVITQRFQ